ncbi:MAG: hypothetical protein WC119_01675 [Synergistaceae bacterium]
MFVNRINIVKDPMPISTVHGDIVSFVDVNPSGEFYCSFGNDEEASLFSKWLASVSGKEFVTKKVNLPESEDGSSKDGGDKTRYIDALETQIDVLKEKLRKAEEELENLREINFKSNTISNLEI